MLEKRSSDIFLLDGSIVLFSHLIATTFFKTNKKLENMRRGITDEIYVVEWKVKIFWAYFRNLNPFQKKKRDLEVLECNSFPSFHLNISHLCSTLLSCGSLEGWIVIQIFLCTINTFLNELGYKKKCRAGFTQEGNGDRMMKIVSVWVVGKREGLKSYVDFTHL